MVVMEGKGGCVCLLLKHMASHMLAAAVINRGVVAKLVGVAPINRDSGTKLGKRFIGGGRSQVRCVL
jgi:transposase